jgi:hypothetical protein
VDLHNVSPRCCARNGNTPRGAAVANHLYASVGKSPCWCGGDIDRHTDLSKPIEPLGLIASDEEDEE